MLENQLGNGDWEKTMTVRRVILCVALVACLAFAGSAWAGSSLQFHGNSFGDPQGNLSFTPGVGDALTISAGGGVNGALITDFLTTGGGAICGGDCQIVGGYMTLTTGGQTSGSVSGGVYSYIFGAGGTINIFGAVPLLGINTSTLLFTANFTGGSFSGSGSVASIVAAINLASITLNPALGLYKYSGASNDDISFNVSPSCSTGGLCTGQIVQSDTSFQTIPEPAALSVLGVGLFTSGTGLRRRILARKPA